MSNGVVNKFKDKCNLIYRLSFADGASYVGHTSLEVQERIRIHMNNPCNAELAARLKIERPVVQVLYKDLAYADAIKIERWKIGQQVKPINRVNTNQVSLPTGDFKMLKSSRRIKPLREVIPPRKGIYRCSICHVEKRHTEFHKCKSRFNGLNSRCKICVRILAAYRKDGQPITAAKLRELLATGPVEKQVKLYKRNYESLHKGRYEHICEQCGKVTMKMYHEVKARRFCSKSCAGKYQWKVPSKSGN